MSGKDFRNGMAAGAGAFEMPLKESADEIRSIGENIGKWYDRYGEIIDTILDDLGDQEVQKLYGMTRDNDVSELDASEQNLLVSILHTAANEFDNRDSEKAQLQQTYLSGLMKYLSITQPQSISDIQNAISNIDGVSDQRTILRSIAEYLYLGYGDYLFFESNDPCNQYISSFLVAEKSFLDDTASAIDSLICSIGPQGLAQKYNCISAKRAEEAQISEQTAIKQIPVCVIAPELKINPKTKEPVRDQDIEPDIADAEDLRNLLRNNRYPVLDDVTPDCFRVYVGYTKARVAAQKTLNRKVFDQYGCTVYAEGYNMVLEMKQPDNIDEIREEIVECYKSISLPKDPALLDRIGKWESAHSMKDRENYTVYQTKNQTYSAIKSAKADADAALAEDEKDSPFLTTIKKAGKAALDKAGEIGLPAAKSAYRTAMKAEASLDQGKANRANAKFDKEILPHIQRSILTSKAAELITNGTVFDEAK